MRLVLPAPELAAYIGRQLDAVVPIEPTDAVRLRSSVEAALPRLEACFARLRLKYFQVDGVPAYDPLHTDQHAMFLYLLSNTAWRQGDVRLAARLYALNKALHAVDIFYELALPEVWCVQHPLGAVLGRATYGEYFAFYQHCLVGVGLDGRAPVFGRGVVLFGGASVVGDCTIGDNVWLSTGAQVFDQDVPSDSLVTGRSPDLVIRRTTRRVQQDFFELLPAGAA